VKAKIGQGSGTQGEGRSSGLESLDGGTRTHKGMGTQTYILLITVHNACYILTGQCVPRVPVETKEITTKPKDDRAQERSVRDMIWCEPRGHAAYKGARHLRVELSLICVSNERARDVRT
jgi:hypothetical protein